MLYLVCRDPNSGKDIPKSDSRWHNHGGHAHLIYVRYLDRATGRKSRKATRLPEGSSLYYGVGAYRNACLDRDRLRSILKDHEWSIRHGRQCRADCVFCLASVAQAGAEQQVIPAGEFSEKILALLASPHETNKGKFKELRRITIDGYRYALNKLGRVLGEDLCFPLSQVQIEEYVKKRLAAGITPRTVNTDLRSIKAVLKLAEKHQILPKGSTPRIAMCEVGDKAVEILTLEQVEAVTEAANKRGHLHQLAVFGLMYQGLRPGDLSYYRKESSREIRWKHVNFEQHLIGVLGKTEKDAVKWLPMNPKLEEILASWPAKYEKDERVFPFSKRVFWKMVKNVFFEVGITNVVPYVLRKTFLSYFAEVNGLDSAQEAARHSSPETTARFYNHVSLERQRKGHDDFLAYFENGRNGHDSVNAAEETIIRLLAKHPELNAKFMREDSPEAVIKISENSI